MAGPLVGLRVIEMGGIGPGPFCAMMLADMGAEVIRIERKLARESNAFDDMKRNVVDRGRKSIALDMKQPGAAEVVLALIEDADALIEGFRPGVMERLGLSPDQCWQRNPRLVYGRMTGWGQEGPLAPCAGHDLNYIALSGALHAMGSADRPPMPPLHLVGDMGGGAMMLAFGLVCALLEARTSGKGQVVDAAICDGAASLSTMYYGMLAEGHWTTSREENLLDGGAHFYGCYVCADSKYISIAPIEPQFYQQLIELCELDPALFKAQWAKQRWAELRQLLAEVFATRSRDEWVQLLEGTDVCFAPVLDFHEAPLHPHNIARGTFVEIDGVLQPAPAPRLSRTPGVAGRVAPHEDTAGLLANMGVSPERISQWTQNGLFGSS
ncbi:CoA transferase [Pseudomonas sp. BGM005]|nr:CoA transferase [Pseudomonas sp. BG5]